MNKLSIFIDESGNFGEYDFHSPYYIIAMVMHDQSYDITEDLAKFEIPRKNFLRMIEH